MYYVNKKENKKKEGFIMALIKCPECGKEISDKAKCCIHCGYPLDELENNTSLSDNKNNLYAIFLTDLGERKVKIIQIIGEVTGLRLAESKAIADNLACIKMNIPLDEANSIKQKIEEIGGKVKIISCDDNVIATINRTSPIPKCPTCGSIDIRKISTTSKAVSAGLFGIFSPKIRKQFHCNSCKYEW